MKKKSLSRNCLRWGIAGPQNVFCEAMPCSPLNSTIDFSCTDRKEGHRWCVWEEMVHQGGQKVTVYHQCLTKNDIWFHKFTSAHDGQVEKVPLWSLAVIRWWLEPARNRVAEMLRNRDTPVHQTKTTHSLHCDEVKGHWPGGSGPESKEQGGRPHVPPEGICL